MNLRHNTNKIVKYNNYKDTTKTLGTIRTKDEYLPINKIYITATNKDYLVITYSVVPTVRSIRWEVKITLRAL